MELRPELCAPEVSPRRLAGLRAAIGHIEELLQRGEPADRAIAAFNADTGHDYTAPDFQGYWESRDVGDFALEAARPARPRVPDVTRDELIEVARRIVEGDIADQAYYLRLLEANVAHPRVSELIFFRDLPPEHVVDEALSYRPIQR
ncbi:hypothetical protein ACQPZJ_38935 [Actinoplanes sp. CA-054009]